jgi:uncharacterized protein YjbJ (UPF0337 family)
VDKDRVKGSAQQAHGTMKEAAKMLGDEKLKAEGTMEKAEGKLRNAVGGMKDAARDAMDRKEDQNRAGNAEKTKP